MSQLEVRWNEKHIVPVVTGKDCEWASWLWSQYGRKNTFLFWDSVRDLMLAGFCLLMLVGCGSSQAEIVSPEVQARASELSALLTSSKTVETKSDEILKAVESNTTALAAIKGQIDSLEASVVSSKPNGKEVIESAPESPAKANTQPTPVQVATPGTSSSRVASDGTVLRWNIEGNWNPTILETSAHLRQDHGIDTNGMTHQEMADIHASIHDGKPVASKPVAMKSETVRYVSRGMSCPNGQCPTSSTRYVRRSRR
jgi:hypothetical protein